MSAPPRPFFLRFTLALLGMLVLMAVVFVGLGWMVARHNDWMAKAIGKPRVFLMGHWYLGFMADLMPDDQYREGLCDGAVLFLGNRWMPSAYPDFEATCVSHPSVIAYCGERVTIRWAELTDFGYVRWPRGFKAVVTVDAPVLLPKGGSGPPTKGPLVVSLNARGELEFDILADGVFGADYVDFRIAANDESIGRVGTHFPGWRTSPIAVSINGGPPDARFKPVLERDQGVDTPYTARWAALPGWTGDYSIEAAREEGEGSWLPLKVLDSNETQWEFDFAPWFYFPGYTGPLKFRVVPVSPTPP